MSSLEPATSVAPSATDGAPPGNPPIAADRVLTIARCWLVAAPLIFLWDLVQQTRDGLTNGLGRAFGDDFINYWSGAYLAWHGRVAEIYDFAAFHNFEQSVTGPGLQLYHYGYPPVLPVLTAPLAAVPYVAALALWLFASWYAFYRTLKLAAPSGALMLSLATPALFVNAVGGQNGAWTAALIGGGLTLLDRRPVVAGCLFGLLIYKPHLGVLLPFVLLAGWRWRAFMAAAVTAIVLVCASILLFGREPWFAYAGTLAMLKHVILEDGAGVWHRMLSVFVFARRLGFEVGAAYAAQIACAVVAIFFAVRSWIRDDPPEIRNALLILGTWLLTPYLQDYDLVMGAFVVVWLAQLQKQGRISPTVAQLAMGSILILPLVGAALGKMTGLVFGPLVIAPVFALFVRLSCAKPCELRAA